MTHPPNPSGAAAAEARPDGLFILALVAGAPSPALEEEGGQKSREVRGRIMHGALCLANHAQARGPNRSRDNGSHRVVVCVETSKRVVSAAGTIANRQRQ
jgi:hypothetical protein